MASRFVLASYLFNKPFAKEMDINSLEFNLPVHKEIQDYVSKKIKECERVKFNDLYELLAEEFRDELSRIAGMEAEDKKYDEAIYFADCIRTLRLDKINNEISRLTTLFASEQDTEKRREFAKEMSKLLVEKNKFGKDKTI